MYFVSCAVFRVPDKEHCPEANLHKGEMWWLVVHVLVCFLFLLLRFVVFLSVCLFMSFSV